MAIEPVLWRRLDLPGHDACRLERFDNGWRLSGTAVFRHEQGPACLAYQVTCDAAWLTQEGSVQGWVGTERVEYLASREAHGAWTLNGRAVPHLEGCDVLDLGFTPATNLFHLRRIALNVGQEAAVTAAWLDVSAKTLDILHQRYQRRTEELYWYEAPRFAYAALLEVAPLGFVRRYPGLWENEG
jgi:uncharacterized protein